MKTWNPNLYLKYRAERSQPSYDLVLRIDAAAPDRILDVGCDELRRARPTRTGSAPHPEGPRVRGDPCCRLPRRYSR